jgi:hypothetical protein
MPAEEKIKFNRVDVGVNVLSRDCDYRRVFSFGNRVYWTLLDRIYK